MNISQARLYTNTLHILASSPTYSSLYPIVQEKISATTNWMRKWFLRPNIDTTELLFFPSLPYPLPPSVSPIHPLLHHFTSSHKHLGIVFDSSLSWSAHTDHVLSRVSRTVGIVTSHFSHLPTSCRVCFL